MKSIYFLLYFTWKGARHGVYAGAFAQKTASPVIDHLQVPMVLSSSRSTPENKKSLGKVQGVPKAPAKDQRLVGNPHEVQGRVDALKHPQLRTNAT
jgi:hypothetical protein